MIQENVRNATGGNMSLFCLGFGYDVHYGFLDVLANQNDGLARRIYEASDAVLQLQVRGLLSAVFEKYTFVGCELLCRCQFIWRTVKARTCDPDYRLQFHSKGFL